MKRLYLVIFLVFALQLSAFANQGISFVYINGSNVFDKNISKWYVKGVQRFHPYMKTEFEQDPLTQKCFLKNGRYFIEENPITFYWGDRNYTNLACAKRNATVSKGCVCRLACHIRLIVDSVLHDIVWIQNEHNKNCVLDDLHKTVCAEVQKGRKIVLYGYSSGSLIAYEYLLARTPYINVCEFFNSFDFTKEQKDFVSQHPMKNTCKSALTKNLAVFSSDGRIMLSNDFESFKKAYLELDKETDAVCTPCNAVIGVVDIASPLVLFNSDLSDPDFNLTYYNRLLYKYIIENDMFWITVNYREDPLSFPCVKNLSIEEIEEITNLEIEPHLGFIYDQSNTRGGITAVTHIAYLRTKKNLSKAVVKAYVNGYRYQYDDEVRQAKCNKCGKCINPLP